MNKKNKALLKRFCNTAPLNKLKDPKKFVSRLTDRHGVVWCIKATNEIAIKRKDQLKVMSMPKHKFERRLAQWFRNASEDPFFG